MTTDGSAERTDRTSTKAAQLSRSPESSHNLSDAAMLRDGRLYGRLFDAAPDAIVVIDDQGKIELVNLQTEALFSYARSELVGRPIEILVPEHLRTAHVHRRTRFIAGPNTRPMGSGIDLSGRRKDGSEFPVEISLSPLAADGRMFFSAAIRDISERKRMEAATRLATDRLLGAVDSIQGMFVFLDAQDHITLCNSTFRQTFAPALDGPLVGRTFREVIESLVASAIIDVGDESPRAFTARWVAQHLQPSGVIDVRLSDGRSLRVTHRRTVDGGTVYSIWDLTEDVRHEEELRLARVLAEEASAAKSDFLSSMSHELRTPLNAILGFAQLVQRDRQQPLSERQQQRIAQVIKGGEHLLHLIDDILDLSSIEAGRVTLSPEPVEVSRVLDEVADTLNSMAARAGITLSVEPAPAGLPEVIADRTRLEQILMNYGSNALKYGRSGGRAALMASFHGETHVRISVIDDGHGIPIEKQDRIFQPFQRAGQEAGPIEGTGIGLSICRRLAECMSGGVGFQSAPGEGSTFWIDLPAHVASAHVAPAHVAPRDAPSPDSSLSDARGGRIEILYIEDNPANIALMKDLMADYARVHLLTAPTAEIGIELTRAQRPDAIIMDINLPGMSGIEAAKRLRQWPETRAIPIIALTAAALQRDARRAEEARFDRYLTKPVKVEELTAVIEEILAGFPSA